MAPSDTAIYWLDPTPLKLYAAVHFRFGIILPHPPTYASSLQTEATLEREALQERIHAVESKLTIAKRERNALLAALRDIQRRERTDPGHPALETPRGGGDAPGELSPFDISSGRNAAGRGEAIGRALTVDALSGSPGADAGVDTVEGVAPNGLVRGVGDGNLSPVVGGADDKRDDGARGERVRGEGCVVRSAQGGARTASLSARLEVLALQTRQLLADDSDSSCSSRGDSEQA